jgi:hypothetical protein
MIDAEVLAAFTSGLAVAVASPILGNWLSARERRIEKQEDYRRQDEVAAKVDQAAQRATEVARVAAAVATEAASTASDLQAGMKQIHTLVNDNLTNAKFGELSQARISLKVQKRLPKPNSDDRAQLKATSTRIRELEVQLRERGIQQQLLDFDAKAAKDAKDAKAE